jgi:hypothetical protein
VPLVLLSGRAQRRQLVARIALDTDIRLMAPSPVPLAM